MRLVVIAVLGVVFATSAWAAGPRCTVGLHVDDAGISNRPGVIVEADDQQGAYKVRYDGYTEEEWVPSRMMDSCEGTPGGARDISFFVDSWDDVQQRSEPDLVIYANGTYGWLADIHTGEIIRGRWHQAEGSQLDDRAVGPGIVLTGALYGKDWVVESHGDVDGNDREQILATDDSYDYVYFSRVRG